MNKSRFQILLSLLLYIFLDTIPAAADSTPFTEKVFPVIRNQGMETDFVTLRFYEPQPSVAYISAADYLRIWIPGAEMKVMEQSPGIYELISPTGKAIADITESTLSSDDISAFTNLMGLVQEGMDNVYYDGMPFIKFIGSETEPSTVRTTFNFSDYSIQLYENNGAVYFPFATLSDIYSDLFYHHSGFNGERIVLNYSNYDMLLTEIDPSYVNGLVSTDRPADLAEFSYNELCFALDHFYGLPGREQIHTALKEQGLDKALDSFGETGALVKSRLKSTSAAEFYAGLDGLNALFFDGGHTILQAYALNDLNTSGDALYEQYMSLYQEEQEAYQGISDPEADHTRLELYNGLNYLRSRAFGAGKAYIKQGDTAVCVFNSFNDRNQDTWDAYYSGKGPLPTFDNTGDDALLLFLDALRQADEDPEVRNLVIDLSTNTGGSADIVMMIFSLITGKSEMYYENRLTGAKTHVTFAADRNFDGVFDEADADIHYDLNFAVLVSPVSFSCANLFASLMKDAEYPVLGERSGGGACAVQFLNTADGNDLLVSSWRACLISEAGENIDTGIPADVELVDHEGKVEVLVPELDAYYNTVRVPKIMDDYSAFYDIERLSEAW